LVKNCSSEPTSPLFGARVGGDPLKFRQDLWHQQTRIPMLLHGIVCVILGSAILVELRRVTDGQMEKRWQHIPRQPSVAW